MKPAFLSLALLFACPPAVVRAAPDAAEVKKAAVLQHAKIIYANYFDCTAGARRLQAAVKAFLAAPDAAGFQAAREAWTEARRPYVQSEAYRFYAGPIDDPDGPEPQLNAWPLDESFIDAPPGSVDPGVVGNDRAWPKITPDLLFRLNQADGEKNVACGWHAVEFLLWGPDVSRTGPGGRLFTDYTTAPHAKRRGEYLQACADLMLQQLAELTLEWKPDELGNYRAVFEEGIDFSVERIVTSLIFLSENELAGERLQVAYDTKDQENEHSCFSDTTWQDNVMDATGMLNVWRGIYTKTDGTKLEGPGLRDICRASAPDLEPLITALLEANLAKAKAIPQPFDQAITGADDSPGRSAIMALIVSLEETGSELRKLAQALKIEVPDVPPEDIEG
jgi:putative iron-regulated protein